MSGCVSCGVTAPEGARFCPSCGSPLAEETAERRKLATVVFCDLVGSTALGDRLDSEIVREIQARYFQKMRAAVELHGGTVEKFIGDAVVAVFGVPVAREDDALRAVRAADEMRNRAAALTYELQERFQQPLEVRIGVASGEVVAGDGSARERIVTGASVNLAARLQQAAEPGGVLLDAETCALVAGRVICGDPRLLSVKGKLRPVEAHPLVEARDDAAGAGGATPFIGRREELERLVELFEEARSLATCRIAVVIGEAGVGKTRLAQEFVRVAAEDSRVLYGRCLSYGDGIAYWPVAEVVRRLTSRPDATAREASIGRLRELLGADSHFDLVTRRVAQAIGLEEGAAPAEEITWAIRAFFEELARNDPLVLVVEDAEWAQAALVETLNDVRRRARDRTILLLCLARPGDRARTFAADLRVELSPLDATATRTLVATLLGDSVDAALERRLLGVTEGNPLFAEQLVSMLVEEGIVELEQGSWRFATADEAFALPATIVAVLGARLDRLRVRERAVAEAGAVEGVRFHALAVGALISPEDSTDLDDRLRALVDDGFITPATAQLGNGPAYGFRHALLRDVTYGGLTKKARAELHERLAGWIEAAAGDRVSEVEEIVGYHLEQAVVYGRQLALERPNEQALARTAAERLAAAGRRALDRDDAAAAEHLLDRAVRLLREDDPARPALVVELAWSRWDRGDLDGAASSFRSAGTAARAVNDEATVLASTVGDLYFRIQTEPEAPRRELLHDADRIIQRYEVLGDDLGLARAWELRLALNWMDVQAAATAAAAERALEHALEAGNQRLVRLITFWLAKALYFGPERVDLVAARIGELLRQSGEQPILEAELTSVLGATEAMRLNFDAARRLTDRSAEILTDVGDLFVAAQLAVFPSEVAMLAGTPEVAVEVLRRSLGTLQRMGERTYRASRAAYLARAFYALGRYDEAARSADESAAAAAADDLDPWIEIHAVRSKLAARAGESGLARSEAQSARLLVERTDDPNTQGRVALDAAEALSMLARRDEAIREAARAAALFAAKGNVALGRRAESLRADLCS
jgi:class 3 adenylate cyclase